MVTRQKMTISRFLPSTYPLAESQQPQGKGRTLPQQRLDDQPPKALGDPPFKTPTRPSSGITIREPVAESQSTAQADANVASSS